jgi:hypothetical protein
LKKDPGWFVRLFGTSALIAILIGLVVLGIGWLRGWHTPIQFSNGFFTAGALTVVIGLFSVMGGFSMRSDFKMLYSQSASDMSISDRTKLWVADITQGYGALILLSLTGMYLIGLAILVGRMPG